MNKVTKLRITLGLATVYNVPVVIAQSDSGSFISSIAGIAMIGGIILFVLTAIMVVILCQQRYRLRKSAQEPPSKSMTNLTSNSMDQLNVHQRSPVMFQHNQGVRSGVQTVPTMTMNRSQPPTMARGNPQTAFQGQTNQISRNNPTAGYPHTVPNGQGAPTYSGQNGQTLSRQVVNPPTQNETLIDEAVDSSERPHYQRQHYQTQPQQYQQQYQPQQKPYNTFEPTELYDERSESGSRNQTIITDAEYQHQLNKQVQHYPIADSLKNTIIDDASYHASGHTTATKNTVVDEAMFS